MNITWYWELAIDKHANNVQSTRRVHHNAGKNEVGHESNPTPRIEKGNKLQTLDKDWQFLDPTDSKRTTPDVSRATREVYVYQLKINRVWEVWANGRDDCDAVFSSHYFLYTEILCFLFRRGIELEVDQYIFIRFKPLRRFTSRYSKILYCLSKLKYAYCISSSTPSRFSHVFTIYHCTPMHTNTHTVRCARNRILCKYTFPIDVCRGQSDTAAKNI